MGVRLVEPELMDRVAGTWMEKILESLEKISLDEE